MLTLVSAPRLLPSPVASVLAMFSDPTLWMSNPVYLTAGAVLVLTVFTLLRQRSVPRERFPPGPQGQFLVGNLADIPSGGYEWDAYGALGKRCGKSKSNNTAYLISLISRIPQGATSST